MPATLTHVIRCYYCGRRREQVVHDLDRAEAEGLGLDDLWGWHEAETIESLDCYLVPTERVWYVKGEPIVVGGNPGIVCPECKEKWNIPKR